MQRSNGYSFGGKIRFSEVDHTGQITLPGIINYFQDCSLFQSEELGLGTRYLAERGHAWVLSAWQIEVERYPRFMEEIEVSTWATEFKGMLGERNFCMTDKDGQAVAYANSLWVYMDLKKGRPGKPPVEEIEKYGCGEPLEMEYLPRKIALPEHAEELSPFPVRKYHIDTNEHVNNCQYVQMAMEAVSDRQAGRVRVEYKKSAVYGDIIFPRIAEEAGRTVVELCDENGKPYAIVEFDYSVSGV